MSRLDAFNAPQRVNNGHRKKVLESDLDIQQFTDLFPFFLCGMSTFSLSWRSQLCARCGER
jgi:hypothetical protein